MKRSSKYRERGFVLLVVLMLLAMSAVLGMSYLSSSSIRVRCSTNLATATRARYLAESAVEHALYALAADAGSLDETGQLPAGPYYADASGDPYLFYISADPETPGRYLIRGEATVDGAVQSTAATVEVAPARTLATEHSMIMGAGSTWLPPSLTIDGDFHINGNVMSLAHISGDASAVGSVSGFRMWIAGDIEEGVEEVEIPVPDAADYRTYVTGSMSGSAVELETDSVGEDNSLADGGAVTPQNPAGVVVLRPENGSYVRLTDNLEFTGTLVVDGHLVLDGEDIELLASDGFPALVVTGALVVKGDARAEIDGVVMVGQGVTGYGSTGNSRTEINGGLVVADGAYDFFLGGVHRVTYDAERCRIYDLRSNGARSAQVIAWHD